MSIWWVWVGVFRQVVQVGATEWTRTLDVMASLMGP